MRGGGPVRGLQAGSRFTLEEFPRDDQNKEYVVVSAAYEIRVAEFESNETPDSEPLFRFELHRHRREAPLPRAAPHAQARGRRARRPPSSSA